MKKYLPLASLASVVLLVAPIAEAQSIPQPQMCPSAANIRAVGVSRNTIQDGNGLWITGRRNQAYGTTNQWTFLLGNIPASNISDAYNKAAAALPSLILLVGPVKDTLGRWSCVYNTAQGYMAVTITPPIAF